MAKRVKYWLTVMIPLVPLLVMAGCGGHKTLPTYPDTRGSEVFDQAQPLLHKAAESEGAPGPQRQPGRLVMKTQVMDQDGNDVFEPNEQVVLRVSVKNEGSEDLTGLIVDLDGSPTLLKTIRYPKPVGDLAGGSVRVLTLTGILPEHFVPDSGDLRILVRNLAGHTLSAESLTLSLLSDLAGEPHASRKLDMKGANVVEGVSVALGKAKLRNAVGVVVGISRYKSKGIPAVKYARRDAEAIATYLEQVGGVSKKHLKLLLDDQATCRAIKSSLEHWLPKHVTADSTVFIYFAGHGMPNGTPQGGFLVPNDMNKKGQSVECYPLSELYAAVRKLPTRKVIVIIDASFAGSGDRSVAPLIDRFTNPVNPDPIQFPPGVTVLTATSSRQPAIEYDKALHGLFTYYLLRGFRGEADVNRDGLIDVGEWFAYARDNVSKVAVEELHRRQMPVLFGGDLMLQVSRLTSP